MRDWDGLPSSWSVAPLELLAEINPRSADKLPESASSTVHFVPMRAVSEEFGGIDVSARRPLGEVQKGYTSFQEGDVLFAKITPCMENGKLALVPSLDAGIGFGSTEFHVMRARTHVAPKWLAYFLSQAEFRKFARRHMTGTAGQLRVATPWLAATTLPVAPPAEQTRIVDKLEELLSDLDAGVAELKAAQKKLGQYRQSLLKAAVEGRLTEAWRAQHGEPEESGAQLLARVLRERRARWEAKQLAKFESQGKAPAKDWLDKYPESLMPDAVQLPELPTGWTWATVDQLSFVVRGASPRPAGDPRFFGGTIPWITVGSLTADDDMYLRKTDQSVTEAGMEASRYIEPNTLLLTNSGATLGVPKITLIGGCINDGSVALLDVEESRKKFLYWFLCTQTDRLRALNQGAAQPNLNTEIVRRIVVPICPTKEMNEIVGGLDERLQAIRDQEAYIERALRQSAAQRKNILQAAFSGQLVPQDPNDEPASVLLERIRAERTQHAARSKPDARKKRAALS